jgi:hypothetical protein
MVGGGGGEVVHYRYLVLSSYNISNMGLCVCTYVSFICRLFLLFLWIEFNTHVSSYPLVLHYGICGPNGTSSKCPLNIKNYGDIE